MRLGVVAGLFRLLAVASRYGAEQGPVFAGLGLAVIVSMQDCELVAKDDDLEVSPA